ncbi:MAG: cytochrome c1 [Candidatus Dactylopiibacterium carminicum]|uniref:Cytochrome c1 n=1 Tax=Candidatus Dactylopiibacterium carminicum TaxID=857335 RepID=A0A272EPV2_9RHOO|nr:cytochrome c1 [Candidatus Dactylopiibacterium carminicum]PAS91730.1 MAG: cytochrome c1 [Candidatus Dactylopiibacterium carminicum]PAS93870.1 MAG: cytochrome c1 [Candidatus Dactylopiibacterium carminicum]
MKKILAAFGLGLILAMPVQASGPAAVLDRAPVSLDAASLQAGAKLFVNYCLGCHGASALRYNHLTQIGLTEQQIKDNLMFTADKVGGQMLTAMRMEDAKRWFGAAPPDLSLIARAKASASGSGADWLYTYLRQFYRDDSRPTGWNNVLFPGVGMPHALWELQGEQQARFVTRDDGQGNQVQHFEGLEIVRPGKLTKEEYDAEVANLVSFMVWMAEPGQESRRAIGWVVLAVLGVLALLSWLLKRAYWKDVH